MARTEPRGARRARGAGRRRPPVIFPAGVAADAVEAAEREFRKAETVFQERLRRAEEKAPARFKQGFVRVSAVNDQGAYIVLNVGVVPVFVPWKELE